MKVLLLTVTLTTLITCSTPKPDGPATINDTLAPDAWARVREGLIAPSTGKPISVSTDPAIDRDSFYFVRVEFEAANAFGVPLRSVTHLIYHYVGGDTLEAANYVLFEK